MYITRKLIYRLLYARKQEKMTTYKRRIYLTTVNQP